MAKVVFLAVVFLVAMALTHPDLQSLIRSVHRSKASTDSSYCLKSSILLTPAERRFYHVLCQAVPAQHTIFAQVRVADILTPEKGGSQSQWQSAFNRISAKHFDFVICERRSLSIKAVVELHDKSHRQPKRAKRDQFLRKSCSEANLLLLEFEAKPTYAVEDIEQVLSAVWPLQKS